MHSTGTAANLLSLGAIDFGIIVDGTVVVIEAIYRRLAKESVNSGNLKEENSFAAKIWDASNAVRNRVLFSVFLIILSLLPILTMSRIEGKLFAPMAWTLSYAIAGSAIYAVFFSPPLALFLMYMGQIEWNS